jgi:hypothetical protein
VTTEGASAPCGNRIVLDEKFTAACAKDAGHRGMHADPAYRMNWTDPKITMPLKGDSS